MKVRAQRMSQPPVRLFHFSAIGCSHSKIAPLKTKKRMVSVMETATKRLARTLWSGERS